MRLRIPLVSAAIGRFEGQIGVWRGWEADGPCYRCLVGDEPGEPGRDCASEGVLGAMAGTIGTMAALETIRALVPFGEEMVGRLLVADLMAQRYRTLTIPKNAACPACAQASVLA
jgi:adenylyltransferase/sulfurtransferase